MTHLNYKSYQKVENLRTFTSKSFKDYCDSKIKECSKHIFFLKKNIVNKQWNGKVCEIGSGNGKLLFRLDKEKLSFFTQKQTGFHLSTSWDKGIFSYGIAIKSLFHNLSEYSSAGMGLDIGLLSSLWRDGKVGLLIRSFV